MKFVKKKSLARLISALLTFVIMCTSATSVYADSETEYVIPSHSSSAYSTTEALGPGRWYFNPFYFYDYNIGSNKTINGNRMRVCIAFKAVDGLYNNQAADMTLDIVRYDGVLMQEINLCFLSDEPDSDGYRYYVLPWIDVSYGVDYHISYLTHSCCDFYEARKVHCHVWIDVE